jgi:integrase
MASYMGMRRGEIVGLKRSDYNQTERSLRVFGKGRKYRLLYVCNEVVEALDQWLEDTTCWGSPWVFPDRINGTHISGEAFYQQFTKILAHYNQMRKAQKLPPVKLHIHGLRHTAVTEWVKKGYSMDDISRWVGHSSPETTRRIYSHLTENDTFLMMKERLANV